MRSMADGGEGGVGLIKRPGSLDALRGFDMIWIIGLEQAMRGFCVLFPGGQDWWFKRQFHHVPWDGLAFYDTIFPLFIFIAGVSFCLLF